jgi:hypothetical protein
LRQHISLASRVTNQIVDYVQPSQSTAFRCTCRPLFVDPPPFWRWSGFSIYEESKPQLWNSRPVSDIYPMYFNMSTYLPSSTVTTGCMYAMCSYHRTNPSISDADRAKHAWAVLNTLCLSQHVNIHTRHTRCSKYAECFRTQKWLRHFLRYAVSALGPLLNNAISVNFLFTFQGIPRVIWQVAGCTTMVSNGS